MSPGFLLHALLALACAGGVAWLATRWLATSPFAPRLLDVPNERSLHRQPVPRTGGLGIWAGIAAGALAIHGLVPALEGVGWLLAACVLLALVSLADDVRHLPAWLRLLLHLAAALALVPAALIPADIGLPGARIALLPVAAVVLSLLFAVWMLNLYNFMDGMDGFAGGMALAGFGTLGLLGLLAGAPAYALPALLVAAASAGFLVVNFPPARIFMGDAGSVPLGFFAAAMILAAERDGLFPWWLGVLVFSPFIVDASITLLRRLLAGERVWQAHRSHYYQRLVQHGWGHRRTVLAEYLLMAACAASALLAFGGAAAVEVTVGGLWVIGYTALAVGLARMWRQRGSEQ